MLLYVYDDSPDQARTHGLIDDALDLIVPLLPLLATPLGRGLVDRIVASLHRAGIELPAAVPDVPPQSSPTRRPAGRPATRRPPARSTRQRKPRRDTPGA